MSTNDDDVKPLNPPEVRPVGDSINLSFKVDEYTDWVLRRLIGIRGRSKGDVAYYILRSWIDNHEEELRAQGIEVEIQDGALVLRHGESG